MSNISTIEAWVNQLGLDHDNNAKIEQFDDRRFKFSLYLLNQDGQAIKIRKGSIDDLYIEDNILDWFHKGSVTFLNPDDIMERSESVLLSDAPDSTRIPITPYRFRGDCRDLLLLTFEPHLDNSSIGEGVPMFLDSAIHTMKFLFSVYASEDIISEKGRMYKKQKLYFHDYRYQMLREKNIYYSTAKFLQTTGEHSTSKYPVSRMNNHQRGKPTGEIVQDILRSSLMKTDTKDMFSYHWNIGGPKLHYTSPSNFKAIDDLQYILDRHVSDANFEHQPCLLRLQRFTERWELLPITEYFARSKSGFGPGEYQSEFFLLSSMSEATPAGIPPEGKTFGKDAKDVAINYHYPDLSVVDDYIFSEMNGVDCQEMLNSVITHRYTEKTKTFNVDLAAGNVRALQEQFQRLYINHTFGGIGGHGFTSWLSDTSRSQNFNFRVSSSWTNDPDLSNTESRNKILLAAFLLGNTIQFDVRGDTTRRAGVWIALDRDNNYIENEYDMKILGQYFVTRVTHRIDSSGAYTNNIMGVKPYFYKDVNFDTNDLFMKNTNTL
jgi:hypothetical protein